MSWWGKEGMIEAWARREGRSVPRHPDEELFHIEEILVTREEREEYEQWLELRNSQLPLFGDDVNYNNKKKV